MSDKRKRKPGILTRILVQIRNIFGANIATAAFGIVIVYIAFTGFMYLTSKRIETCQVIAGPLSRNETYTGLSVRTEKIYQAESSGYVNYYAREGGKINANGAVYGLSASPSETLDVSLSAEELAKIRSDMLSFSKGFTSSKFNNVYSFKNQLEGDILQYEGFMENTDDTADASGLVTIGNQNICKAPDDGIVLYSEDGYEGKNVENLTEDDFNQASYHETDLKTDQAVQPGIDIFTLITDERWSLIIPLSDKQASYLEGKTAIRVKFLKDDMTQSGGFSIIEIDGKKYGQIDFNRGLIRYASDRFLDIELVTNTANGLKVPVTALDTKDFYTIPSRFFKSKSGNYYITKLEQTKNGSVQTEKAVRIYKSVEDIPEPEKTEETEDSDKKAKEKEKEKEKQYIYYIDTRALNAGDVLINRDTDETYTVGETDSLQGVYCVNQGYAVFCIIEILDQNDEYYMIAKNVTNGVSRYDQIVRNASQVTEEDILY